MATNKPPAKKPQFALKEKISKNKPGISTTSTSTTSASTSEKESSKTQAAVTKKTSATSAPPLTADKKTAPSKVSKPSKASKKPLSGTKKTAANESDLHASKRNAKEILDELRNEPVKAQTAAKKGSSSASPKLKKQDGAQPAQQPLRHVKRPSFFKKILLDPSTAWFALSAIIVFLDQLTKITAANKLVYQETVGVFSWFDLHLVYNPGAAFSFLANADGWQRPLLVGISLLASMFLCFWIKRVASQRQTILLFALALILGGAFGNLIDRALTGYVVDFISLHYNQMYFPAFNLADSAISVGAVLLLVDMFGSRKKQLQTGS